MTHRIEKLYDFRFSHFADSYKAFEKVYKDYGLGTSPFGNKAEFDYFKSTHKFSRDIRRRLMDRYYSDFKDRKEKFIDDMERRALAVLGGGYMAAKTEQYRKNIVTLLDKYMKETNDNPTISYTSFESQTNYKEKLKEKRLSVDNLTISGLEKVLDIPEEKTITLRQYRNMIQNMSAVELHRISAMKDIAPDFRAYGSKQEGVYQPELKNISLFMQILSKSTDYYLVDKYSPENIYKDIFYKTLPKYIRETSKGKSMEDMKKEMVWDRFKRGTLYGVRNDGSVYMRFIKKAEQPTLQKYINERYEKEGE